MKVRMIVSRDGTMILADDCVLLEVEESWADILDNEYGDNEKYSAAIQMGAKNV